MASEKFHYRKEWMKKLTLKIHLNALNSHIYTTLCDVDSIFFLPTNRYPLIRFNQRNKSKAEISSLRLLRAFMFVLSVSRTHIHYNQQYTPSDIVNSIVVIIFFFFTLTGFVSIIKHARRCENYLGKDWCMIFLFGTLIELFLCMRATVLCHS